MNLRDAVIAALLAIAFGVALIMLTGRTSDETIVILTAVVLIAFIAIGIYYAWKGPRK